MPQSPRRNLSLGSSSSLSNRINVNSIERMEVNPQRLSLSTDRLNTSMEKLNSSNLSKKRTKNNFNYTVRCITERYSSSNIPFRNEDDLFFKKPSNRHDFFKLSKKDNRNNLIKSAYFATSENTNDLYYKIRETSNKKYNKRFRKEIDDLTSNFREGIIPSSKTFNRTLKMNKEENFSINLLTKPAKKRTKLEAKLDELNNYQTTKKFNFYDFKLNGFKPSSSNTKSLFTNFKKINKKDNNNPYKLGIADMEFYIDSFQRKKY